jgi:hypothetical protein
MSRQSRLDALEASFPPSRGGDTCLACAGPGGYRRLTERGRLGLLQPGPCAACGSPNYAAEVDAEHQRAAALLRAAGYLVP